MRIVHLSDIHFNKSGCVDLETFLMPALLNDLTKYHNDIPIDFVLISGDLIYKGGFEYDTTQIAFEMFSKYIIKPICENGIDLSKIVICPGNHDINRKLDNDITEKGLKQVLTNIEQVNSYIDSGEMTGRNRIIPYNQYEQQLFSGIENKTFSDYFTVTQLDVFGECVGVISFNTSWRAYSDDDKGNLILGERAVTSSRPYLQNCAFKIAVMHHPVDWLVPFEQKKIGDLLSKDFDMLFCGHVHEGDTWSKEGMYGKLFVSVAPSNCTFNLRSESRLNSNGYVIIDIDNSVDRRITVHHRKYVHQKECYCSNTDIGDDEGKLHYNVPTNAELNKMSNEKKLAENIQSLRFDEINSHLLSYNTETKAPKNISEIFVRPNLISKIQAGDDLKEEEVTIETILNESGNVIIFGCKESGKTLLLDDVLIEFVTRINEYHLTPVYMNFDDIGNNQRIETIVSQYLAIGITELKSYITSNKLVLLIDNLKFSDSKSKQINRIEEFVRQNGIKVIATYATNVEGDVPLELAEHEFYSSCKLYFLKNFKSKHIKELIGKWFHGNEQFDTPDKLQKVAKMLTTLKLPRTPLSISMFLWIIEQQENYKPINHSTMLENFIERLFQKQSKKELYHETFDFKNKVRLLSDIAYEMYKSSQLNYRLTYPELNIFIQDRITIKKFPFVAEEILDHFLDKGILVKEIDNMQVYVRFRFSCFFQYFLMKRLDYDPEFKNHVLHEDNYLNFCNEIDYYTGVYRDKDDILMLLLDRIESEYKDIICKVSDIPGTYDAFFEVNKSATSAIDHKGFISNIKENKKPADSEIEKITDNMLEATAPDSNIEIKGNKLTKLEKLDRLWLLLANVLKNTEETEVPGLKDRAYESVIKHSMAFAAVYKTILTEFISRTDIKVTYELKEKFRLIDKILPLLLQVVLHSTMGTAKLSLVIKDKLNADKKSTSSELEKFISVFMYADIRGKGYKDEIKQYIKTISAKYIYDMTLIKLLSYYHLRSKTKDTDLFYENLLAELITKSKNMSKADKPKIMLQYNAKKKIKQTSNSESDE